jgi:hypothetical protein
VFNKFEKFCFVSLLSLVLSIVSFGGFAEEILDSDEHTTRTRAPSKITRLPLSKERSVTFQMSEVDRQKLEEIMQLRELRKTEEMKKQRSSSE